MVEKIVVGLFEARGIAEDVRNRLVTDGTPPSEIAVIVLHDTAPLPSYMEPEITALEVDPLLLGTVRETYAPFIHNGETCVFVHADDEAEVDAAIDTMRQYAPIQITVTPADAWINGT